MDGTGWATVALVLITVVLVLVTARQARLQEASAYRDQATAWRDLAADWQVLAIVGLGPEQAARRGFDTLVVAEYQARLTAYRDARVRYIKMLDRNVDAVTSDDFGPDWELLSEAEATAWEQLRTYEPAVRRVLIHLAQVADLVLRRRLSINAVYDALGHDLRREQAAVANVTKYPADESGCPGSSFPEMRAWGAMSLDDVSPRVGWGMVLVDSPATLGRIDVLVDLIVCRGLAIGDQPGPMWMGADVRRVVGRRRQAFRWNVMARQSRWLAVRTCVRTTWLGHRPDLVTGGIQARVPSFISTLTRPLVVTPKVLRTWWDSRHVDPWHRNVKPVPRSKKPRAEAEVNGVVVMLDDGM
jgi:hypothetical protein